MPCNLNAVCFIDQHNEIARTSNFVVNAVGVVNSYQLNANIFVHIVAFYPRDTSSDSDLERFERGDIIRVQGRFSIVETDVDGSKVKVIKV
jgi:hypothetical protein